MDALRMAAGEDAVIEGWLVPFDSHLAGGRDSYGTQFSARTDYRLDWFPTRPLLYQHGLDPDTALEAVGVIRSVDVRDKGVWMQAQLDQQGEYFGAIRKLVEDGKLYLSSGSVEHLVQINARTRHVDVWPIIEGSLTPTPANLLADIPVKTFRAAVPSLPDDLADDATITHRAVLSGKAQDDLPDSAFAYVEPGTKDDEGKTTPRRKRHLPYKGADGKPDGAHVRNALSRLDQTDIPASAKASARKILLAAAKELGIDAARSALRADTSLYERSYQDIYGDIMQQINPPTMFGDMPQTYNTIDALFADHVIICRYDSDGDGSYWDIPYVLGADLEPVLDEGNAQQVDKGYVPATARSAEIPLAIAATDTIRHVAALAVRTKDYGERRFREGRMLSGANLKTISDTADGLEMHAKRLRDLHQRAKGEAEDAARAAYYADPNARRMQIAVLDL